MTARNTSLTVLIILALSILGLTTPATNAGEITYVQITGDDDSGISVDNVYTHKLDFGQGTPGALINGVQFDPYNSAANGTLNFNREVVSGSLNDHPGNGNHNVSGALVQLLTDMYYNGNNAAGGVTTWTLSGLTPGKTYHTRIYSRQWGASDQRNVTFVFDPDGPGPLSDSTGTVSQDNATSVGFANGNDAYYINYQFKAVAGQDLVITLTQDNVNQSWHLYGLTNQEFSSEGAVNPTPAHEAIDVPRDTVLTWEPGEFAVTHNLYLGESFADVDSATLATEPGLDVNSFDPGRLDLGKTYYWRVDEVNGTPDLTEFKGDVWSFTVEPVAYPVTPIAATASSTFSGDMGPEKTMDGSGLDVSDLHNATATDMWLSSSNDTDPWIQYEFDKVYKLHEMWVWNSNQLVESFVGFGSKDVSIELSTDGVNWTALAGVPVLNRAPGTAGYAHNTVVDFGGGVARFVKISIQSGWGTLPQYGLAEVRFFSIPTYPREFQPAEGFASDDVAVTLSWRAGREAAEHEIYLGTDPNSLVLVDTVSENTYLAESLDYGSTYYWQVVEVNEAETPAQYEGEILSFTTPAYAVIDDIELYDDKEFLEIWAFWADGYNDSSNGAIVGNGNLGERIVVYEGNQSMPIAYDNSAAPSSEVTLQVDNEDWTASGIKTLSLMVFGNPDNTGQLYVKIDGIKKIYDGDTALLQQAQWLPWYIDLSSVNGDLSSVATLTIGVEGANTAGKLYIDMIHLLPQVLEFTKPAISFVKITGDEDCGISADNTYTHKLDLGQGTPGALINGVQFDAYNSGANGTLNFNREISSGSLSDHPGNGNHNVSGDLVDLLTDMYYNGGTAPGGTTTWTLSGLTAGQTYQTRVYTRQWGPTDDRNATFVFDPDGDGPIADSTGRISQDNALSAGFAIDNDAYYISYEFTAVEGEDLVITLTQHINTYSWHLYGLTNQEVSQE